MDFLLGFLYLLWLALIIFLLIFLLYFIPNEFFKVAEMKGYHERKYFWIPFFFGIAGYLLIIALPDRTKVVEHKIDDSLPEL